MEMLDCLQSLKQFFIKYVTSNSDGSVLRLKQSHQSYTGYKYMIWHIDEKLF